MEKSHFQFFELEIFLGLKDLLGVSLIESIRETPSPDLWSVFRARHGSRIVGMSLTLRLTLRLTLKLTAREPIWHIAPAFPDGPRTISLAWRRQVENVPLGRTRETQGIGSKLWLD